MVIFFLVAAGLIVSNPLLVDKIDEFIDFFCITLAAVLFLSIHFSL